MLWLQIPFFFLFVSLEEEKEVEYPDWFLRMPYERGAYFAVGYAPRYRSIKSSFEKAKEDLKKQLAFVIKSKITGERGFIEDMYMGENIKVLPDTESVKIFEIVVLDSAIVHDMALVLGMIGSSPDIGYNLFSVKGKWWEKLPEEEGYLFAVGSSPIYYYEHNSWKEAEHNARVSLAMTIETRIKSLHGVSEGLKESITQESVDVILEGAQIVARHIDRQKGACYVLICMPFEE